MKGTSSSGPRLSPHTVLTVVLGFLLVAVVLFGWSGAWPAGAQSKPRNVILMIGDGMGAAHLSLTRIATVGSDGTLAMDRFPNGGMITTQSLDNIVTDSAAGGTALATGNKTNNAVISQSPDGGTKYETLLEKAQKRGKSTGLVTTARITDATPAVFVAHMDNRNKEDEIAGQMAKANVDVLLGGGARYFLPSSTEGSKRKDDRNVVLEMKERGYAYATDRAGLMNAASGNRLLGLFSLDDMIWELDRDTNNVPSLAEMAGTAIQILNRNSDGFFLMVEGGLIDHASHANDAAGVIAETEAFDKAVDTALNFANSSSNTLVVVTADHNNAGLSLARGDRWVNPTLVKETNISYEKYGVLLRSTDGAEAPIRKLLAEQSKINDLTKEEVTAIQDAIKAKSTDPNYDEYTLTNPVMDMIGKRAGITWTTHGHEGTMVPLLATGPGANQFGGMHPNTYVGKTILELLN